MLLTRSILTYKWNLLMPISKVDENMKRAQKRDAVRTQRFWWRKDIFTPCSDDKVIQYQTKNCQYPQEVGRRHYPHPLQITISHRNRR